MFSYYLLLSCLFFGTGFSGESKGFGPTYEELEGRKYEFLLFENFDGCAAAYRQETQVVQKLKNLRKLLANARESLLKPADDLKALRDNLQRLRNEVGHSKGQVNDWTSEYPKHFDNGTSDNNGAIKGLSALYRAYDFDATSAIVNGTLTFLDLTGETVVFQSHEKLNVYDAEKLVKFFMEQRIYSMAINLAYDIFEAMKIIKIKDKKFVKRMEKTRLNLVKINNGYLAKKAAFVDKMFEIHPFMIDDNMMMKDWRKQPAFVQNGSVYQVSINGPIAMDWLFFKVCREGKFLQNYDMTLKHCKLLHHGDPYLKLGPFKEELVTRRPFAVVFHDILSETEITELIKISRPNLSRTRDYSSAGVTSAHEAKKKRKTVSKTVQYWIDEVLWPAMDPSTYVGKNFTKMNNELVWKLNKKIALATQLETQSHFSTTRVNLFQRKTFHDDLKIHLSDANHKLWPCWPLRSAH